MLDNARFQAEQGPDELYSFFVPPIFVANVLAREFAREIIDEDYPSWHPIREA